MSSLTFKENVAERAGQLVYLKTNIKDLDSLGTHCMYFNNRYATNCLIKTGVLKKSDELLIDYFVELFTADSPSVKSAQVVKQFLVELRDQELYPTRRLAREIFQTQKFIDKLNGAIENY